MSIPLDRLYHYIQDVAEQVHGDRILIYRFSPHGSKNIEDLTPIQKEYNLLNIFWPQIYCYDQEPLDYDRYQAGTHTELTRDFQNRYQEELTVFPGYNLRVRVFNIYDKCLLLHSEQQSPEVNKYQASQFIPVYYWAHAIIALDWFRYAQHVEVVPAVDQKLFLVYNRAWAGTREYRIKFVELLQKNNLLDHCVAAFNAVDPDSGTHYRDHVFKNPAFETEDIDNCLPSTQAASAASADFDIQDYANTQFEVVLETLFDDSRIQLTEKILRPIACGHPFILASTPGSLKYLQNYGFRTFDGIIDESYDQIQDPVKRLTAITAVMTQISEWSPTQQKINQEKIKEIVQHNKRHFFSAVFFQSIVDELQNNLRSALTELEETNTGNRLIQARIDYYRAVKQQHCQAAVDEFERNRQHLARTQRLLTLARQYRTRSRPV
jgi:uncharacterized protein YeaO (DUF488 family)